MVMLPKKEGVKFAKELAKLPSVVVIDIETIPSQEKWVSDYINDTIKHPGNIKKQETIDKWNAEDRPGAVEDALDKCGLYGETNHIVAIGVAINDRETVCFTASKHTDEKKLLEDFYKYLSNNLSPSFQNKYVGHNIAGFDFKIIKQRGMVLGIKPSFWLPFDVKPWESDVLYDTMIQWDSKNYTKLDKLAKAFGIQGKTMDGSQVYSMWKNGLIEQISDYCKNDVEIVRKLYYRMQFNEEGGIK